jgi:HNH endonuclease/AP2 domain
MAESDSIPIAYLRECFDYEPETGTLRWRKRPLSHFIDDIARRKWNTRWAGREAGQKTAQVQKYLYVRLTINGRQRGIYVHRAAWALINGKYPPDEIDHDDRDGSNNRLTNLVAATRAENCQNVLAKGWWLKRGRFAANIRVNRRTIHLGTFDTKEEAHQAYLDAKKQYHQYKPIIAL